MTATRAVTEGSPPERLRALAQQVRHLVPSRHDPERFHRDKDSVEAALRRLARELERSPR